MISESKRAVILAKLDGKVIQCRIIRGMAFDVPDVWRDVHEDCWIFQFERLEYRIKPEPRRWWVRDTGAGNVLAHASYESASASQKAQGGKVIEVVEVIDGYQ